MTISEAKQTLSQKKSFASVVSGYCSPANTTDQSVNSSTPPFPTNPTAHHVNPRPPTITPVLRPNKQHSLHKQTLSCNPTYTVPQPSLKKIVLF